jgi:hypothetical protein
MGGSFAKKQKVLCIGSFQNSLTRDRGGSSRVGLSVCWLARGDRKLMSEICSVGLEWKKFEDCGVHLLCSA